MSSVIAKTYVGVIGDVPSRELMDLAELTAELKSTPVWEQLTELVDRSKSVAQRMLTDTSLPTLSQADYARAAGFLSGADLLPEIVQYIERAAAERQGALEAEAAAQQEATERARREQEPEWPEPEPAAT